MGYSLPPIPHQTPNGLAASCRIVLGSVRVQSRARERARLDQICGGSFAVHVITGATDAEKKRDGDFFVTGAVVGLLPCHTADVESAAEKPDPRSGTHWSHRRPCAASAGPGTRLPTA
jgi:hypothetical protein